MTARLQRDPRKIEADAAVMSAKARELQADGKMDESHALILMAATLRRAAAAIREGRIRGIALR